ncbi:exodeoxyribonuclease V, beta subunit [Mycolicibacterium rhodesiae JS60]|nr:exodeoxyribonuclease V, beta subunit [Mycolicibacterium rhodesiae JS60]
MHEFDLLGPLPAAGTTTVLEASAGTGKTFTLAALVTRYIAEGRASLDQMLLITFSRAATQELRERVREALQLALRGFDDPRPSDANDVVRLLTTGDVDELAERRGRLRDALAGFDAATIATTHQFCHLVLKSLGVAGDTDSHVTLAESLDDLVGEIVDDLYLRHFGQERERPPISRSDALKLAREVVANPCTELRPLDPPPGSQPAIRVEFANDVLAELDRRKRRRGILSYDDLLSRLADALEVTDSPAATRMHQRWSVVMVDEFQDTDPVQWQVIERAFSGNSTLILIGDPKQAIYAFRGGDIFTYLHAAKTAGQRHTLGVNWRSDSALVERLQVVLGGAELGDSDIKVLDVDAHHRGHRLAGAPRNEPFRLRVVSRETFGQRGIRTIRMDTLRQHIAADLATDISGLLAAKATFDGEPLQAHHIAVITESHADARACFDALATAGVPAVYTGDTDVLKSAAADDWLTLLEAFDQLHRPGLVRAAATTMFFGKTAEDLADGGDALTDKIADTLRQWADHAREAGVAAVFEAAQLAGMGRRVLSWAGGERNMTDLAHVTQLLHDVTHRERFSLTALRDWLRTQRDERSGAPERSRRLDSDAAAVQIMTVWVSKGLQFPIVYLPFTFNRYVRSEDLVRFHVEERRCLHVGGDQSAELVTAQTLGRREAAGEETRLTYVAMTRAQSQVVAWWAPSWDEPNGGLSRLLRGRRPGQASVPDRCDPERIEDADAVALLREWETAGGPVLEESVIAPAAELAGAERRDDLAARHFHRSIDTTWRRTSYSGLIRAAETAGVSSEPEVVQLDDEVGDIAVSAPPAGADVPSPMADLPTGATFGSLVHAVLETADPLAADLAGELQTHIEQHSVWWPVDVAAEELAAALVPMHDTSLGPLADGITLRQIGLRDRLCEMDFEFPLAGGDLAIGRPQVRLADVGRLLGEHLPPEDPLASYAERLSGGALGGQSLRGYLSGSVDVVLRIPDRTSGHRYLVVDYKTNWLGAGDRRLSAADYGRARMAEAMLHADYPLQALLYSVVLHRFLRWRQPGYDPDRHLGGVLYLFVRGMCGPDTPTADGHPAGVFSWRPSAVLVAAVSDLLDGRQVAA